AGTGAGLQDGGAEDPRAAADGGEGAGTAIRRPRVPRRPPRRWAGAAAGAGGAGPRLRRRPPLIIVGRPGTPRPAARSTSPRRAIPPARAGEGRDGRSERGEGRSAPRPGHGAGRP